MKTKLFTLSLMTALILSSCAPKAKTAEEIEIFNGKNLDGWVAFFEDSTLTKDGEFSVVDGVITASGKFGYIRTEQPYSNYELNVEWRWPEVVTNSGIFLHMVDADKIWPNNFECQLQGGNAGDVINSGGASSAQCAVDNPQKITVKANASNEKAINEWNSARIICSGDSVQVYINGVLQNSLNGLSQTSGFIGLQGEGEAIEFRNIVLKSL